MDTFTHANRNQQQRLYCEKYEALKYKFLLDVDLFTTLMGQWVIIQLESFSGT